MRKLFSFIDRNIDRVGYWVGFYLIASGAWAWLVKHSSWVPDMNWADAIIIGILATSALLFLLSLASVPFAVAYRKLRPNASAGNESGLTTLGGFHDGFDVPESSLSPDAAATAPDRASYYDLLTFTTRYVLPACDALIDFQKEIIRSSIPNEAMRQFAIDGLFSSSRSDVREFWRNYNTLEQHINQSEPTLKFNEMIRCIRALELRGYGHFRNQASSLAKQFTGGDDINPDVLRTVAEWVSRHNSLVEKYEEIRNDPRFSGQNTDGGSLFWPRRRNGFGPPVTIGGNPMTQLTTIGPDEPKALR